MILACHHISKEYPENVVLRDVTFHLERGDKAALIGINGAGKTTLLRIIVGQENADEGSVSFERDCSYGYLAQNQGLSSERTVYEEVLSVKQYLIDMEEKLSEYEKQMEVLKGEALTITIAEYTDLLHRFERENGYAYKGEVLGVLKGLGFTSGDLDQKVSTLSGGQKTRVALGKLLLQKPDLLMLDEPTNHLDMNSIRWLETYLMNYKGTVLVVSHDRYFLDRTVNKIIELENGRSMMFGGNYSAYAERKKALREQQYHAYMNNQAQIRHQEEVIEKLRRFNREKSIRRAESREKMLQKTEVLEKPVELRDDMHLTFTPCIKSGREVLSVDDLAKSYGEKKLFSGISFKIRRGEHVALIGDNGTGKSTILGILNEVVAPDKGVIRLGTNVHIGYYDQEHHVLHDDKTVFEEISDEYPSMTNTQIRSLLASFLFTGEEVFKRIGDLSGGEKGRVSLAKLMLSKANFLSTSYPRKCWKTRSTPMREPSFMSPMTATSSTTRQAGSCLLQRPFCSTTPGTTRKRRRSALSEIMIFISRNQLRWRRHSFRMPIETDKAYRTPLLRGKLNLLPRESAARQAAPLPQRNSAGHSRRKSRQDSERLPMTCASARKK